MPRISERRQLLDTVEGLLQVYALCDSSSDGLSDDSIGLSDDSNSFFESSSSDSEDDLLELYGVLTSSRYLNPRSRVEQSHDFYNRILQSYSDVRFRRTLRISRSGFERLKGLIEGHKVFHNNSFCEQFPLQLQMSIVLYRLGHYGNGSFVLEVAAKFGVGEGTVNVATNRVLKAINSLRERYIRWPDAEERKQHAEEVEEVNGFPNVVGFLDGTDIVMYKCPGLQGEVYFNRKKHYAISTQVICNYEKKIIYLYTGYPGSVHDSRVARGMKVITEPNLFFSPSEYLLADSAYELTERCVVPYRKPAANIERNKKFNYQLSHIRIAVEHCIGILKERWPSLKGLRINLYRRRDHRRAVKWIEACAILHNMAFEDNDAWSLPQQADEAPEERNAALDVTNTISGEQKRNDIQNIVLQHNYE